MKKNILLYFFFFSTFFLFGAEAVFAQNSTSTNINARLLPTVWYSTLSINDGENVKIYSAIQNNSNFNFTGTTTFYIDDKEISQVPFSSEPGKLKDVSTDWLAQPGDYSVQIKVSASLPSGKTLVSYESEKSSISITKKVVPVPEKIPVADVASAALGGSSSIITKVDQVANSLAGKIESFKKPVGDEASSSDNPSLDGDTSLNRDVLSIPKGKVLGMEIEPDLQASSTSSSKDDKTKTVFNMVLDALAFLVRNWKWTLIGLVVLFVLYKFPLGRRRR